MRKASTAVITIGFVVGSIALFLKPEMQRTIAGPVMMLALGATFVGIYRAVGQRRQWWMLLGALCLFSLGVVIRELDAERSGIAFPYPSRADVPISIGFILLISGLLTVVRSRSRRGELAQYADMILVSIGVASLYWAFVVGPAFGNGDASLKYKLMAVAYAAANVAVIALAMRLVVGPGIRNRSLFLLTLAQGLLVAGDFAVSLELSGISSLSSVVTPLAIFGFVATAGAMLHPSLGKVLEPHPQIGDRISARKAVGLALAGATPILILGIHAEEHTGWDNIVRLVIAILGGAFVALRMLVLVRAQEERSRFEGIIGSMASHLSVPESESQVFGETVRAAHEVLRGEQSVAILGPGAEANHVVEAVAGSLGLQPGDRFRNEQIDWTLLDAIAPGPVFGVPESQRFAGSSLMVQLEGSEVGVGHFLVVESAKSLLPDHLEAFRKIAQESSNALRAVHHQRTEFTRRSTKRLQALTAHSSAVVMVVDANGIVEFCTSNAGRLFGTTDAQLEGTNAALLFRQDERETLLDLLAHARQLEEALEVELVVERQDGSNRWFRITLSDQGDQSEIGGTVITAQDINDRHNSEARVLRSEARFRSLVQRSSDIVAICDEDGILTYISPAVRQILGYEPAELIGTSVLEIMPMSALSTTSELRAQLVKDSTEAQTFEIRTAAKDGSWRYLSVSASNLIEDEAVEGFVLNVRDDTERLSLERSLRHQATHDSLTKLANRPQFTDALVDVLSDSSRLNEVIGVMFIDIDDFKTVNDGLGHAAGDQVLIGIGERLRKVVRLNDVVARFGGDEFAILLTNMFGVHEALEMAGRILEEVAKPMPLEGRTLTLGASIGLAFDRTRSIDPDELIKQADVAMYSSKDKGKGRVTAFNDSMMTTAGGRLDLIDALRSAIDGGQITVHYQPIVNLQNGRIVGFEALARWEDPERGMISPAGFIPVAEETGLIEPLGLNVLKMAANQLRLWVAAGHDIYVSVNVSVKQLQNPTVVRVLSQAVEEAGLDFDRIMLEVTETVFVADKDLVSDRLKKLRAKGFRIAIDDFGTGYSSLQYLQQFEFDVLKIDKSFVDRIGTPEDTGMVQTVLDLANRMGATTVAEGIEGAEQATELRRLKCELGQGYYYARPMSADKTNAALAAEPLPMRDATAAQVHLAEPAVEKRVA